MKHIRFTFLFITFIFSLNHINAQYITTIAGNGSIGHSGDGGPAILAEFFHPWGIAVDTTGNVYLGDNANFRLRKINLDGIINTIAGSGTYGHSGDGGPATGADISAVEGVAVDRAGNIYFADDASSCIHKVAPSGIITTYAGTGTAGYTGDGGPATAAELKTPHYVAVDTTGNVYITDISGNCIRKVNPGGIISTIAGNGTAGYSGDGGPATAALINGPSGIAADNHGNIYFSDNINYRIRKINAAGIITTFAGTGTYGFTGDGGPATAAEIWNVNGVAIDKYYNIYMTTYSPASCVRKVDTTGTISTIAGNGVSGFGGDGGLATAASLDGAYGIAISTSGNIYIADASNERIREITSRPYFTHGDMQSSTNCNGTINVDTLLEAYDTNSGNTETWGLVYGPFHGTAAVADTAISTGNLIIPTGLTYTPVPGFSGVDTFRVVIADGLISDTTTIYMVVQLPAHAGTISGPDTVCKSRSITLADTATGGTWTASNSHAFVSGGSVVGTSPGMDTISYTVTNSCGSVAAKYTVTVKACTNEVNNVTASDAITLYPNPGDGTFTLSFSSPTSQQAQVVVTNLVGEKIKELTIDANKQTEIALGAPAGVYFVGVVTKDGMYNVKVVVQ